MFTMGMCCIFVKISCDENHGLVKSEKFMDIQVNARKGWGVFHYVMMGTCCIFVKISHDLYIELLM